FLGRSTLAPARINDGPIWSVSTCLASSRCKAASTVPPRCTYDDCTRLMAGGKEEGGGGAFQDQPHANPASRNSFLHASGVASVSAGVVTGFSSILAAPGSSDRLLI